MHVKDGMKYLGLKEWVQLLSRHVILIDATSYGSAKDILPGMEVRLIPHQTIGVSWYDFLAVLRQKELDRL
jgi:hypothetical protein